jgi:hypothetical protein
LNTFIWRSGDVLKQERGSMQTIDRRILFRNLLVAAAAAAAGSVLVAAAAEALPLDPHIAAPSDEMIQKTQVVVVHRRRRRRRRWVCWWRRGRRVCGWRWI